MKIKEEICNALEGKGMFLIQKSKGGEKFECICPYCKELYGIIEDPGYFFSRVEPPICWECEKEFEVEDKLRYKK